MKALISQKDQKPGGEIIRLSTRTPKIELPPADTKRWVMRRKAQVVTAVRKGVLTEEEALARYNLSPEEFDSWKTLISTYGVHALRTTRLQEYRGKPIENTE
jgi:hypothetical protein